MARGKKPAATGAPQVPGQGFPAPGQPMQTPFGAPPGMPQTPPPGHYIQPGQPQQQFQQAPMQQLGPIQPAPMSPPPGNFPGNQQAPIPGGFPPQHLPPQATPPQPQHLQAEHNPQAQYPGGQQFAGPVQGNPNPKHPDPNQPLPPFGQVPMAPVPGGLPGMAGQVNQDTVLGIMQQGGAGVSGDPAVAAAITGILGTLAELQKGQKALQDTVGQLGKNVSDLLARQNVPQAPPQVQQQQAPAPGFPPSAPQPPAPAPGFPPQQQQQAPAPPTMQVPNQNDPSTFLLKITGQAVSQMLAGANGQQFYDQDPAVWQALSTIAGQNNIQASPDQMRQLWHSAGKVQNGILVP